MERREGKESDCAIYPYETLVGGWQEESDPSRVANLRGSQSVHRLRNRKGKKQRSSHFSRS